MPAGKIAMFACSLFLIQVNALQSFSQSTKNFRMGVYAAQGIHTDFLQPNISRYRIGGESQLGVSAWIKSNTSVMAFAPRTGISIVNYRYKLSEEGKFLLNHFIYINTGLNAIVDPNGSPFKLLAGIYLKNYIFSELVISERNNTAPGLVISYSEALDKYEKEEKPNKVVAGITIGCAYHPGKSDRILGVLELSQDAISTYDKNHTFGYSLYNHSKRHLRLNGKPTTLSIKLCIYFG